MLSFIISQLFLVRVNINSFEDLNKLMERGIDITHNVDLRKGFADVVVNESQYADISKLFPTVVLSEFKKLPIDFGPYYTYSEAISKINQWHNNYPSLVSRPETIGITWENRVIYGVKIGNINSINAPVIWINTAIHAREPGGVSSVIGFIDYLLENYGKDPEITYLLNNRIIYYVPVTNPDGYTFNEVYASGLWRKNKRDNNGNGIFEPDSDGVDLNRNFGYMWGCCGGSSPDPTSPVYRGPSAFSEPESQAYRDKFNALNPEVGIDIHAYSNLILWPWGYTSTPTTDDSAYKFLAWKMFRYNAYRSYQAYFLYPTDGTTDDWIYGDNSHPKALAFTWEVGEYFWQTDTLTILEQVGENIPTFLILLKASGPYIEVNELNYTSSGDTIHISLNISNMSFKHTLNNLKITMNVLTDSAITYLDTVENISSLPNMPYGNVVLTNAFSFISNPNCQNYIVRINFTTPDGFSQTYYGYIVKSRTVVFQDDFNSLANWNIYGNGQWGIVNGNLTESPNGNYGSDWDTDVRLKSFLNGTAYDYYELEVGYSNSIEGDYNSLDNVYDYGSIEISNDNKLWIPLKRTWGIRNYTVENYNITRFVGDSFNIRLKFFSDGFVQDDGWEIDYIKIYGANFTCTTTPATETPISNMKDPKLILTESFIKLELPYVQNAILKIYSMDGKELIRTKLKGKRKYTIETSSLKDGVYVIIAEGEGFSIRRKYLKLR